MDRSTYFEYERCVGKAGALRFTERRQSLRSAGATLTLNGILEIPNNGNITVESGGKLIVDDGTITPSYGEWSGKITVKNGGQLKLMNNALIKKDFGEIITEKGGILEILKGSIEK